MTHNGLRSLCVAVVSFGLFDSAAFAQISGSADWAVALQSQYRVASDVVYLTANNVDLKLDVYTPRTSGGPVATFVYFHGGGWVAGTKETNVLRLLPYLERGWAAVNVQYRLGPVSPAPAAVEDSLCALRWVVRNAADFNFDIERLVVSGNSAGGHLALTTGMLPASSGLDRQCPGEEDLRVAAIVNWYGITDVVDLLDGRNRKNYAVQWLGSRTDRNAVAEHVSPLSYVRTGLPPIISIHGDADPVVPYTHATRLHGALEEVGTINQLLTVPGGGHGGFAPGEMARIYSTVFEFLDENL